VSYQEVAPASGGDLINSPRWLGKLNYSTPLPWVGLRLGYELQYDARRLTADGSSTDGYWLSNLNLSASNWAKGLEVSLGIHNVFDQRYWQPAPFTSRNWQNVLEQDGRSVRAGMEYRF
jgi:iron complex outermembrane receptor protein